jgi:DNA-binding transcriptional regulator YhcF (GntR family)
LKIKINFTDDKPLFSQIADAIADDILIGVYKEDEAIISTTQLSRMLKINPTTAVKAVGQLADEGLIYKRRGLGMFVKKGASEKIREKKARHFYDVYVREFLSEAQKLGLTTEEIIEIIRGSVEIEN